jgi:hypothetical protein
LCEKNQHEDAPTPVFAVTWMGVLKLPTTSEATHQPCHEI